MVAIVEILREQFEVQSGGILSTGGQALGYNVIDTRYEPTDPRHIVRTFDNAQAAQNYSNEINARLRSNPNFDPRSPSTPAPLRADPNDRIGATPQDGTQSRNPIREYPRVPMGEITDINDSRLVGTDELTPQQRRTLRDTGRVVIGQLTYTPEDIAEADRRFTRYLNTTRQTSLAKMSGEQDVQTQARNNLRILSGPMAARVVRRTFVPVVFSPAANVAAIYVLRDMLSRKQQQILDDPNYTAEMYDVDVQRVMGGWWLATMMPLIGSALKGTYRLSAAAWNQLNGRVKRAIDRANGTPRTPTGGGPRRWIRYGFQWFVDWLKTEATAAAVVTMVGRWTWMQEQYLWFLSLAYVSDVVETTGVAGDALETIIRRGFPDAWGGADTFDNLQDFLQNELMLDPDAPLDVRDADGNPNASQPVTPADQGNVITTDELFGD